MMTILKDIKRLANRGYKEVKKVVNSQEFKLAYRRGILFSVSVCVVVVLTKRISHAADNPSSYPSPSPSPKGIHPTHNWRERLFSKKYALSNAGLASGILTVGISGYYIYSLYNDNLVLQGKNMMLRKAQTTLQLTIHRGAMALARSNKAIEVLEKTLGVTVQAMDILKFPSDNGIF